MLRPLPHSLWRALFLLALGCVRADTTCTTRRCLAEALIKKEYLSQPQGENCTQRILVPFLEYQTLSVDTKNLRLISRLQASLVWWDPELAWNVSVYPYDEVILPVKKIWTPEIHVTNGITTTMKHFSPDLLVDSNGTVKHTVIISAEVNCEINLFNYPFASDACPVAIQAWTQGGCGTELAFQDFSLKLVDGSHGDWQTNGAMLLQQGDDRYYLLVELSIKMINPFITLLLPSILLVLADMVSFALPLGGGERNSFKVTLVLSFTMFIIILNDQLPGDSNCSPVIRTHFCVCLVLLVVSMLASMVLTRWADDGGLFFCCCSKRSKPEAAGTNDEKEDEVPTEAKADISVVQLDGSEENSRLLRKVVNFLEGFAKETAETESKKMLAKTLDKTIFWLYFIFGTIYFICMIYTMAKHQCVVNHFGFWY